jgi:hypothetical protein
MIKIHLCALLLAFGIAAPALADDWDASDAIGNRPVDEASESDAEESSAEAPALRDGGREESERSTQANDGKRISLDDKAKQTEKDDPNKFSSGKGGEPKRNVLGPLWGVPSGSPVMQTVDPDLEKQYAVSDKGELVPQPEAEEQPEAESDVEDEQRVEADDTDSDERESLNIGCRKDDE